MSVFDLSKTFLIATVAACAPLALTAPALASQGNEAEEVEPLTLNWDDLRPEGELERLEELYAASYMMGGGDHFGGQMSQIGTFNVEQELIGQTIRMPGFILPLDAQPGGEIGEFLLVPYFGACVHTPPPPPNQIVHVVTESPITVEQVWSPVWVWGELTSERVMNELGDAAYTLHLVGHEPYEY